MKKITIEHKVRLIEVIVALKESESILGSTEFDTKIKEEADVLLLSILKSFNKKSLS